MNSMINILMLCLFLGQVSFAKDVGSFATQNFAKIQNLTEQIYRSFDPKDVLVVFDIDNTLLKLTQDLGSEQWYMWQNDLINKNIHELPAIANSSNNLLEIQSWIYQLSPMELVDPLQQTFIQKLKEYGTSVIALTSRDLSTQRSTLREVSNNMVDLSIADELDLTGEGESYVPYQLDNIEASGLTDEDVETFKLGEARKVLFDQGVFFTQGQHKGAMLKTLLARMGRRFKAVIFIDDRIKHIQAMRSMAGTVAENIWSVHFKLSESWTLPFFQNSKDQVNRDWCYFAEWLDGNASGLKNKIYNSCSH